MVAVIDYDAGNIMSVVKAVEALGDKAVLSRDRDTILNADHVILPGVGSFGVCMEKIRRYGLEEVIQEVVLHNTPFLGICLGMQLMFDSSEESEGIRGLSILPGKICRIPEQEQLKIPNIGWNSLDFPRDSRLYKNIPEGSFVYFVHSYYLKAADESMVTATIDYSAHIHASVEKNNIFGCQFHPEKSSTVGLQILKNFLKVR